MFLQRETGIILMDINWNRYSLPGIGLLKKFIEYNAQLKVVGFTSSGGIG
jgi:hypothetical protein